MSIKTALLLLLGLLCATATPAAIPEYKIVTGTDNDTYMLIGEDLAKYVATDSSINLTVLPSNGSVENVRRLRDEPGTKLALVQSDVYQAFRNLAAEGNREAARLINPMRVILPLYDEEIHFIVRAGSPLTFIHEIKDKKINIGTLGSGTAMTTASLYRLMFDAPLPAANASMLSNEEALIKLIADKTLDVVVVVAGQPVPLFSGVEPGVEKYFKLLKLDPSAPASIKAMEAYPPAAIKATSYPNWLTQDMPTHSVKTLLVTYDYSQKDTRNSLLHFGQSLCRNFASLQKNGHPKWQQVKLDLPPLEDGQIYFGPTESVLRSCDSNKNRFGKNCTLERKILGLCVKK